MPSPDYLPGSKYGVRAIAGDTFISDVDTWSQALVADIESKLTGYVAGTHAARLAATALEGQVWRETDTGSLFFGTGTGWVAFGGSVLKYQAHAWTTDDQTSPASGVSQVASWTNYPAPSETVTLIGAVLSCVSQGATPSVFKIQTDHASHGTMVDVAGLTGLTPATGGSLFVAPTGGAMSLAALDRVTVICTTSGTSKGLEVEFVTGHLS